jgi:hypothetical protein
MMGDAIWKWRQGGGGEGQAGVRACEGCGCVARWTEVQRDSGVKFCGACGVSSRGFEERRKAADIV